MSPNKVLAPEAIRILNRVDMPAVIVSFCVPTRILRIIARDETHCAFVVEEFVQTGHPGTMLGTWTSRVTHSNAEPWKAYPAALKSAGMLQSELIRKLRKRMAEKFPGVPVPA